MAATPVTSALWKFVQLTRHSAYFPALVEGAALATMRTYTPGMLAHVAAQKAVTNAITLTIESGITSSVDTVLEHLLSTNGAAVDAVILSAVNTYTEPDN